MNGYSRNKGCDNAKNNSEQMMFPNELHMRMTKNATFGHQCKPNSHKMVVVSFCIHIYVWPVSVRRKKYFLRLTLISESKFTFVV